MKINKKSWHYKAISKLGFTPSKSFCMYFWQIPLIGMYLIVAIAIGVLAICATLNAVLAPIAFMFAWDGYFELAFEGDRVGAELLAGVVWFLYVLFGRAIYRHHHPVGFAKKEPSIIVEYIKAKKQKICPILEFED